MGNAPKTCLFLLLFFIISKAGAGDYYHINDRYYKILGTTNEQGMNDAIAAIRSNKMNVFAVHSISDLVPVWTRNHEASYLSSIMPHFFPCIDLPVDVMSMNHITDTIPGTSEFHPIQHALDSYESVSHVPDNSVVYELCTFDYVRGYNTVILNYLILHPDELESITLTLEMILERNIHQRQAREQEEERLRLEYLHEMTVNPTDCPPTDDDYDELPKIDIEPHESDPMNDPVKVIPIDPSVPPGRSCNIPIVMDDIDLLPLTDFLKDNQLL